MNRLPLIVGLLGIALLPLLSAAQPPAQPVPQQELNQNAIKDRGEAPKIADPTPFASKDGKIKGWKVVIPGNRPLATPAVVDGKVFVGGGFGSHEFYAFNAKTGKKEWLYQTGDDGPTAAVVSDGYIGFNTESCELEILTMEGQRVWKKWLGDPLMSMPAIDQGKVYMAYPDSKGDHKHYLACFELKTGKPFWKHEIAGEVITSPVVADEKVYVATLEGTMYCFGQHDGEEIWKEKKNATSSPVIWNKGCYFSRREAEEIVKDGKKVTQQTEILALRPVAKDGKLNDLKDTKRNADDLDFEKRKADSKLEKSQEAHDAGVGFAGPSKGDGKLGQAQMNLGRANVSGVWSYQGSRPFIYKDKMYSAMGDTIKCVDPKTEKVIWSKTFGDGKDKDVQLDGLLTPPSIVNDRVFLATSKGEVVCLTADKGEMVWHTSVAEPILFQPAVAKGRVYVSTNSGSIFCLETGDEKDDGWLMWGANGAHNGVAK
jgi:Ca-activated chloride channel family protein